MDAWVYVGSEEASLLGDAGTNACHTERTASCRHALRGSGIRARRRSRRRAEAGDVRVRDGCAWCG